MFSSELYQKSAESCFENCRNSPASVETYIQATNECTNNLKNFTQELIENFKNVLVRLDEEDKKVKDQVHNLNSVTLHFESFLERRRRCTIGTICSPSPMENSSHFTNNSPNSNVRNVSKFLLMPAKLQAINCATVSLETAKIDLKSCYMMEMECANNQLPTKLTGISCKKMQNNLSTLSPTSSFWNITESGKMPFKINTISIPASTLLIENAALARNVKILSSINLSDTVKLQNTGSLNSTPSKHDTNRSRENTARYREDASGAGSESIPPPPPMSSGSNAINLPSATNIASTQSFVKPPSTFKPRISVDIQANLEREPELETYSDESINEMNLPPPPPDDMINSTIQESDDDSMHHPMVEVAPVSNSPLPKEKAATVSYQVVALYSYEKTNDVELSFEEGDVIKILQENPNQWDMGMVNGKRGFVPRNFVKRM